MTQEILYHVSMRCFSEFDLAPKVYLDEVDGKKYMQKRINVSTDPVLASYAIITASMLINANLRGHKFFDLCIYRVELKEDDIVIDNADVVKRGVVWDAELTKETWVTTDRNYRLINTGRRLKISTDPKHRVIKEVGGVSRVYVDDKHITIERISNRELTSLPKGHPVSSVKITNNTDANKESIEAGLLETRVKNRVFQMALSASAPIQGKYSLGELYSYSNTNLAVGDKVYFPVKVGHKNEPYLPIGYFFDLYIDQVEIARIKKKSLDLLLVNLTINNAYISQDRTGHKLVKHLYIPEDALITTSKVTPITVDTSKNGNKIIDYALNTRIIYK